MSAPFRTISVGSVAFSDCSIRARSRSWPPAPSKSPMPRRHHEQNRKLAERVESSVGQQNPGDDVGDAELSRNQIDIGRRQRRQRNALAVVHGDGREDDAEQSDQNAAGAAPHHVSLRRWCRRHIRRARLRRTADDGLRGASERVRGDRIGHQHEIDDDQQLQAPAGVVEGNPHQNQRVAQRGRLRTGLNSGEGVGHAEHAEAGGEQKHRANQNGDAAYELRHHSFALLVLWIAKRKMIVDRPEPMDASVMATSGAPSRR